MVPSIDLERSSASLPKRTEKNLTQLMTMAPHCQAEVYLAALSVFLARETANDEEFQHRN